MNSFGSKTSKKANNLETLFCILHLLPTDFQKKNLNKLPSELVMSTSLNIRDLMDQFPHASEC